jgi:hypothetical protein
LKGFHEGFGSRLGDGTQVVDKFLLGHTNTGILDGKGIVNLVWDDSDSEVWFEVESASIRVSDRDVSDFVQGIRSVGDQFSEEDFLVGVEGVDDETHQLLDISIE